MLSSLVLDWLSVQRPNHNIHNPPPWWPSLPFFFLFLIIGHSIWLSRHLWRCTCMSRLLIFFLLYLLLLFSCRIRSRLSESYFLKCFQNPKVLSTKLTLKFERYRPLFLRLFSNAKKLLRLIIMENFWRKVLKSGNVITQKGKPIAYAPGVLSDAGQDTLKLKRSY